MNISELFEAIQDELLLDDLNGEFLLDEDIIIWSYNITEDSEEAEYLDDDEESFNYTVVSSEEALQETYQEDFTKLEEFLNDTEEIDNWTLSDSEIVDGVIVFKIY